MKCSFHGAFSIINFFAPIYLNFKIQYKARSVVELFRKYLLKTCVR